MPRIDVYSDLKPAELNAIGLAIFKVWSEFALGQRRLGGRSLKQPTGAYQSSLKFEVIGKGHVAVISDTGIAPHAKYIESGHRAVDMLMHLRAGRPYPMQRTGFFEVSGGPQRFSINPQTGKRSRARSSGLLRAGHFVSSVNGIVRTPKDRSTLGSRMNTSRTGPAWTIPAMPAYSPTKLLMALFANRVASRGGTIGYTP